jgi:hypothetical protein
MRAIDQPLGNQVAHATFRLPDTVHPQKRGIHQFGALLFHQRGSDNNVDGAKLIFQGEEDHPFGCLRPLSYRDYAAAPGQLAIAEGVQDIRRHKAHFIEALAQESERVTG